jgi:predicted nucleic acid-binding protein
MTEIAVGSLVYVDTNVFIYFLEGDRDAGARAEALFAHADRVGAVLLTSELTAAECLYKPHKDGNLRLASLYGDLFDSGEVQIIPLTGDLARRAAGDAGALGLRLIDSIHYLSALEAGCDVFVSADARFRSGPYMRVLRI